ncbi:MAG: SdpI family protein, partial [Bizionia sp.]|nr:SdpI family protein [Bizionia sp.]
QVQWDFSQKYSAKLLIICGLTLTIISFTGLLIKLPSITEGILSAVLIIGAIVVVLVKTEKAIKSKFDS